jgi:hypothetical protein
MTPDRRRSWRDLSGRQRRFAVVAAVVQFALLAAALFDLRGRPSTRIRGPKLLWVAASFVNFVGPVAYFSIGRRRGPGQVAVEDAEPTP